MQSFYRSKILSLIAVTALLVVMAACGGQSSNGKADKSKWSEIKEEGKIVVGTSGTLYGSSYHPKNSDELSGYDVEVVKEIAKRLKLEVEFKEMGFDAMMTSIKSGKIDIAANDIQVTEARKKKLQFSKPYKYSYGVAIVRAKNHSGIESLEDLKGKRAGGAANTVFSQVARKFGGEVVTYGNATNDVYLRDVDLGRTDVILNDYYLCLQGLNAYPKFDLVIHPDIKFNPSQSGIVMDKGNDKLQQKINSVLKEMKKDGTLTKLSKKFYLGHDVSIKPEMDIREVQLKQ